MRKSRAALDGQLAMLRNHARLMDVEHGRMADQVRYLEGQLVRTQEWLERFQGGMATWNLKAEALRDLVDEADSHIGLVVHRYPGGVPTDLRENMAEWRRKVAAERRGGVSKQVHEAASKAVGESPAGSSPAAPTGAVQEDLRIYRDAEKRRMEEWEGEW